MSYSIDEAVDDGKERIKLLAMVKKRFPKATKRTRSDGLDVWFTNARVPADGVEVVTSPKGVAYLYRFVEIDAPRSPFRVYVADEDCLAYANMHLDKLRLVDPKAYAVLVSIVTKHL